MRRTSYMFTRKHRKTGEIKEDRLLIYPNDYRDNPEHYHRQLDSGVWETQGIGIPLSEWRKRKTDGNQKWVFDHQMIAYAMSLYGADTYRLDLKADGRQGGRYGNYQFVGGYVHCIRVKRWLTPDTANETLHHEIQHAVQIETLMKNILHPQIVSNRCKAYTAFLNDQGKTPYSTRPIEVDARKQAARRTKELQLVIPC